MEKSLQVRAMCNGVYADFDYKEIALFALLVGNRLSYTRIMKHDCDIEILEKANKKINQFLDKIDSTINIIIE